MMEDSPSICDYEGSDYQERFWERGDRAYEDRAEAVALRRLLPPGGGRLVDLGAGAGRHAPRYLGFEQIVLLDYARSQLEQARQRLGSGGRYLYVLADVYRLPFAAGVFDAATMIRTMHHLVEPQAALREARGILRPSGTLVLEFANKRNLKAILRWLLHKQDWNPFELDPVEFAPLHFDFHPLAVQRWLAEAGFAIGRRLTVSHFRIGLLKRKVPVPLLTGLDALVQWTGDWFQLSPSVFLRAEAVGDGTPASAGFWRCPACGSLQLEEESEGVHCRACGRLWTLQEGIYDFRGEAQRERRSG
jgi:ubiquinone/menaquinone biosynthesis C-methylase UbiE